MKKYKIKINNKINFLINLFTNFDLHNKKIFST